MHVVEGKNAPVIKNTSSMAILWSIWGVLLGTQNGPRSCDPLEPWVEEPFNPYLLCLWYAFCVGHGHRAFWPENTNGKMRAECQGSVSLFFLVGEVLSTHQTFWLSAEDSQQKWEDLQSTCSRCCPPLVGPELSAQTLRCSCRERCAHLRLSLARGLPRARERLGLCGRGSDGSAWRRESISKEKDFEGQGPHSPSKYH